MTLLALAVPGASAALPESPYIVGAVRLEGLQPDALAAGGDGTVWFSSPPRPGRYRSFGRLSPLGEVSILGYRDHAPLVAIPGGVLWTEHGGIEGVTDGGEAIAYPQRHPDAERSLLAAGGDGSLWFRVEFTDRRGRKHAEIDRIVEGQPILRRQTPASAELSSPVVASDGAYWAIEPGAGPPAMVRVGPDGRLSRFRLPRGLAPQGLAAGPRGDVFLALSPKPYGQTDQTWIDRIGPGGAVTQFPIPHTNELRQPVFGPDGDLWFVTRTEAGPETIDSMTPDGRVASPTCVDPSCDLDADLIAAGPENVLYVSASLNFGGSGGGGTGLVGLEASEAAGTVLGRFEPPPTAIAAGP